jgi:prolyl-tRNA synthetase
MYRSGRWAALESVHFRTTDRLGVNYCLQPTHEESITQMVGKCSPISHKLLPLRLYQVYIFIHYLFLNLCLIRPDDTKVPR